MAVHAADTNTYLLLIVCTHSGHTICQCIVCGAWWIVSSLSCTHPKSTPTKFFGVYRRIGRPEEALMIATRGLRSRVDVTNTAIKSTNASKHCRVRLCVHYSVFTNSGITYISYSYFIVSLFASSPAPHNLSVFIVIFMRFKVQTCRALAASKPIATYETSVNFFVGQCVPWATIISFLFYLF